MKKTIKILSFLTVLVIIFTTVGVSATWYYQDFNISNSTALSVSLNIPPPVEWDNKDILPAEHARLLEIFIREINDPESIVHDHIDDRIYGLLNLGFLFNKSELGSMDEEGEPLKKLFSCETSSFILDIHYTRSGSIFTGGYTFTINSFDMYTSEVDLSTKKEGDVISPVYKTTVAKNAETGEWELGESIKGQADFGYYDEEGTWENETIPSFNISTWTKITS